MHAGTALGISGAALGASLRSESRKIILAPVNAPHDHSPTDEGRPQQINVNFADPTAIPNQLSLRLERAAEGHPNNTQREPRASSRRSPPRGGGGDGGSGIVGQEEATCVGRPRDHDATSTVFASSPASHSHSGLGSGSGSSGDRHGIDAERLASPSNTRDVPEGRTPYLEISGDSGVVDEHVRTRERICNGKRYIHILFAIVVWLLRISGHIPLAELASIIPAKLCENHRCDGVLERAYRVFCHASRTPRELRFVGFIALLAASCYFRRGLARIFTGAMDAIGSGDGIVVNLANLGISLLESSR